MTAADITSRMNTKAVSSIRKMPKRRAGTADEPTSPACLRAGYRRSAARRREVGRPRRRDRAFWGRAIL